MDLAQESFTRFVKIILEIYGLEPPEEFLFLTVPRFKNHVNGIDNIGSDVNSIVEDKNMRLWFATKNGLYKLENGRFTKYTTANGLSNNNLISLAVDNDNNLWIGSRTGINYYDGKTFEKIMIDDVFNSNNIWFLIFDRKESLWIGTNSGVFVLDAPKIYQM